MKTEEKSAMEEVVERVNEELNSEAADEGKPAGEPAPKPPEEPRMIEIDGEKYSLDDVKAWKSGHLMEADYTRKTQALAAERRAMEARETALQSLLDRYESTLKGLTGDGKDEPEEEKLTPEMKRLMSSRDRKIQELTEHILEIRGALEHDKNEAEQARVNEFIVTTADSTIRALMKEKNVPEPWFDSYRDLIAMRNPDCADPVSGDLSKESISSAIRREFGAVHDRIQRATTAVTKSTLAGLKPEPRKVAPAPRKAEEEKKPGAPNKRKDAFDGSVDEMMDKLNSALSGRGAEEY